MKVQIQQGLKKEHIPSEKEDWQKGVRKGSGSRQGQGWVVLTEEVGEPLGLVVVNDSNTQRVEGYQTEHSPVEGLSFDHTADVETHPPFLFVKKCRVLQLGTFNAGSGKGRPCQGKDGECQGVEEINRRMAQARIVARGFITSPASLLARGNCNDPRA